MFKQLKSAVLWFYLFKFRRSLSLMVLLGLIIFFSNSLYADIVDYLRLTDQLNLLKYVILIKWSIIFSACLGIFSLGLNLVKNFKPKKNTRPLPIKPISLQEEYLRQKDVLTSKADQIINDKIKQNLGDQKKK